MKKNRLLRRLVVLCLCCLLSFIALSGCSNSADPMPAASSTPTEAVSDSSDTSTVTAEPVAAEPETEQETAVEETPAAEPTEEAIEEPVISWEDRYAEGQEYFSEENYEDAILAFTEAIEIDPEHAPVFVSRGDAYVLRKAADDQELEDNLTLAWTDYETASEIDETYAPAYLGMSDVLIRRESFEEAYHLLSSAIENVTEEDAILEKVQEFEQGNFVDSSAKLRRKDQFDTNGVLQGYTVYEYDFLGRKIGWRNYGYETANLGFSFHVVVTLDENDLPIRNDFYDANGSVKQYQTMEYDEKGQEIRRDVYVGGEHKGYYLTYYDEEGKETGYDTYDAATGKMLNYWRYDYDENGNLLQENCYDTDGQLVAVRKPSDN